MSFTLNEVFKNPKLFEYKIKFKEKNVTLRPLLATDVKLLTQFLLSLSKTTQESYILDSYDGKTASQMCEDINRYDKLRFVGLIDEKIVGLFEFSMDLTKEDINRFNNYGIKLKQGEDCRFGPCISNNLQGTGIASILFPYIIKIAKILGQKRIILWGGVFSDNNRAIKYYKRNGFKKVGEFINNDGRECMDMIFNIE